MLRPNDWGEAEQAIHRLEGDGGTQMRVTLLARIRGCGAFTIHAVKKKVIVFQHTSGARLVWGYGSSSIQNLYLGQEAAKLLPPELVARLPRKKHSAQETYADSYEGPTIEIHSPEDLDVLRYFEMDSFDAAITRWISVLQKKFRGFTAFDPASPGFDQEEREYKLKTRNLLLQRLEVASTDLDRLEAVHTALANNNMVPWRAYWSISPKGDADRAAFAPAVSGLVEAARGDPEVHSAAVAAFVRTWMEIVPNPQRDHARQVAGFVLMLLNPEHGIYFRRTVLDRLYEEATGTPFPRSDDPAVEYAEERDFAQKIANAFRQRGLAPRDLIDVQSALWVVSNPSEEDQVEQDEPKPTRDYRAASGPLNTILYGPPGTGKTYITARRAVEICDGSAPEDETELRSRYEELVRQKRIEFVTFHQTYGYEEFVEGLRPDTGLTDEAEDETGPGFRLKPVDGVLKRIAERARKLPASTRQTFDPNGRRVFKVSLGRSNFAEDNYLRDECLENGYVLLGYGGEIDWSGDQFDTIENIARRWRQEPDQDKAHGNNPNVLFPHQLRNMMREGDIVLASRGTRHIQAVGIVSGPYRFERREIDEYHHRRPVEWRWIDRSGDGLPVEDVYAHRFSMQSIYGINNDLIRWDALRPYLEPRDVGAPPPPHVLIIDEINRANVSKVMGELITLLEEDKRDGADNEIAVTLPHSGQPFTLPSNLYILGTMNTADRSIALLDTALRRRFVFEEMAPDPTKLHEVEGLDLGEVLKAINDRLEWFVGPDMLIGHAWLMGVRTGEDLDAVMANKVIPLLREYFHEDLGRVRAVLGGGDGFLRREPILAPPGMTDEFADERWRYVDCYRANGCYEWSAYEELITGNGAASA